MNFLTWPMLVFAMCFAGLCILDRKTVVAAATKPVSWGMLINLGINALAGAYIVARNGWFGIPVWFVLTAIGLAAGMLLARRSTR